MHLLITLMLLCIYLIMCGILLVVVISSARQVMDFIGDIGKAYAERKIPNGVDDTSKFPSCSRLSNLENQRIKTMDRW